MLPAWSPAVTVLQSPLICWLLGAALMLCTTSGGLQYRGRRPSSLQQRYAAGCRNPLVTTCSHLVGCCRGRHMRQGSSVWRKPPRCCMAGSALGRWAGAVHFLRGRPGTATGRCLGAGTPSSTNLCVPCTLLLSQTRQPCSTAEGQLAWHACTFSCSRHMVFTFLQVSTRRWSSAVPKAARLCPVTRPRTIERLMAYMLMLKVLLWLLAPWRAQHAALGCAVSRRHTAPSQMIDLLTSISRDSPWVWQV